MVWQPHGNPKHRLFCYKHQRPTSDPVETPGFRVTQIHVGLRVQPRGLGGAHGPRHRPAAHGRGRPGCPFILGPLPGPRSSRSWRPSGTGERTLASLGTSPEGGGDWACLGWACCRACGPGLAGHAVWILTPCPGTAALALQLLLAGPHRAQPEEFAFPEDTSKYHSASRAQFCRQFSDFWYVPLN